MKRLLCVLLACVCTSTWQQLHASDPLDQWHLRSPVPTPNPIRDIAYGNGLWVAVGDSGTVLTSADNEQSWALQDAGVTNNRTHFSGIVFANNQYVAVGSPGLSATSPNGTNWTLRALGARPDPWNVVTHGNGRYIAGGISTTNIAVSPDGTNWTLLSCGLSGSVNDIVFAQGLFVAVGAQLGFTPGFIVTSPDGTNWTARVTNHTVGFGGVAYGNGRFVAVGNTATALSPDGVNWTLLADAAAPARLGVAYGNGLFTAVGASAPNFVSGISYTSTNGSNWVFTSMPPLEVVRFANGRFAAVGAPTPANIALSGSIYFATNGVNWNYVNNGFGGAFATGDARWRDLVFGNGQFGLIENDFTVRLTTNFLNFTAPYEGNGLRALAFGNGRFVVARESFGVTVFASSANNWQQSGYAEGLLNALTFGSSLWVGVGQNGFIATSANAEHWSSVTSPTSQHLLGVAHGGGAYVTVGAGGTVARSTDGSTWTVQSLGAANELRAVTYAAGQFVAVGYAGRIFTSPDGTTWTARISGTLLSLNAVSYCLGRFVAVGDGGLALSSADGVTWTKAYPLLEGVLRGVAASPTQAVAVGDQSNLQTSANALTWKAGSGMGAGNIWRVIYHNGRFVAAMDGGVGFSDSGRIWRAKGIGGVAYSVIGQGSLLLAVGSGNSASQPAVFRSTDGGDNWSRTIPPGSGYLAGVAYGNGVYVALGQFGAAFSSIDAIHWTARTSGTSSAIYDVAFGNNVFVATIAGSTSVLVSPNGTNWTLQATGLSGTYDSIVFRDGLFHAAGTRIATSPDGIAWTDHGAPSALLIGVEKALGKYVAYGTGGTLLTSTNLTNWVTIQSGTLQEFKSAAFGSDTFVIVGRGGVIYQCDYLANTPINIVTPPAPVTVLAGNNASFTVSVTGRAPFSYQWFKNGALISGARASTLTLSNVTSADAGNYHVVVNNDTTSATSPAAMLTVQPVNVGVHPPEVYLFVNTSGAFNAAVSGATPLGYQWRRGDTPLAGATNATLVINNAQTDDSGEYSVWVTFAAGQLPSTNAGLLSVISSLEEISLYLDPAYVDAPIGSMVEIAAIVAGPVPLSYQWLKNGEPMPGITNATLALTNVQPANTAEYTYYVVYPLGTLTNEFNLAFVNVFHAEPPVITGSRLTASGTMQISFTGLSDRSYQLDYTTSLAPPVVWDFVESIALTGTAGAFQVSIPLFGVESQAYFRIRILPP